MLETNQDICFTLMGVRNLTKFFEAQPKLTFTMVLLARKHSNFSTGLFLRLRGQKDSLIEAEQSKCNELEDKN